MIVEPYPSRALATAGGLAGAAGVALSAATAHAGAAHFGTVAALCLAHAPVFLLIGMAVGANRAARAGGLVILAGLVLFSADLLLRDMLGVRLFPMAAPVGGLAMIAGWLVLAASPWLGARPAPH